MPDLQVDLTNCDIEPIHIPGQIQSHGFLIVVDQTYNIRFYSDNVAEYTGNSATQFLGKHIREFETSIGSNEPPEFIGTLITLGKNKGFDQTNPYTLNIHGKPFYLIISVSNEYFLLEFEPAISDLQIDLQKILGRSVSEMLEDKNLQRLLNNSAQQVKQIIGYDRVMIYRFAEDGHGEVVAETRNDDLESWIGLHYPASDIPKQARDLYKKNFTRLIANVNTTPSPISTSPDISKPLDLTNSALRAVSPIHIQYLKNMGVASSFSISLLYKKELWGLIACHNYTPRFIDFKSRESSKLIGQILSSALEFRQDEENQSVKQQYKTAVDTIANNLLKSDSIEEALTQLEVNLLSAIDASGALLYYQNKKYALGNVPSDEQMAGLTSWIKSNSNESFFHTSELPALYPEAEQFKGIASGMMITVLSRELSEYIIWFKPEQAQTIKWAGNPDKQATTDASGMQHISPRHSFEVWTQTVAGRSKEWTVEEIASITRLREEIFYAINQKAGVIRQLNDKLKHAYEELDTFSFTISHDLKNPLSTVKSYSQILLRNIALEPKARQIIERIENGADKMNLMINEVLNYSRVGRSEINFVAIDPAPVINELLKDLVVAYNVPDLKITLGDMPAISGDPVMVSQVFANLVGNAVKYSIPSGDPQVEIFATETEQSVTYVVKDNGIGIPAASLHTVFDLFNRMDNVKDIEGSGVGLAIVKRIVDKHRGRIWAESELGSGSIFYVEFLKHHKTEPAE